VTVSQNPVEILDGQNEVVIVTNSYGTSTSEGEPGEQPEDPTLPPGAPEPPLGPDLIPHVSGADVSITHRITPGRVGVDGVVRSVTVVRNLGPEAADGVVAREIPPAYPNEYSRVSRVLSLTATSGHCTERRGGVLGHRRSEHLQQHGRGRRDGCARHARAGRDHRPVVRPVRDPIQPSRHRHQHVVADGPARAPVHAASRQPAPGSGSRDVPDAWPLLQGLRQPWAGSDGWIHGVGDPVAERPGRRIRSRHRGWVVPRLARCGGRGGRPPSACPPAADARVSSAFRAGTRSPPVARPAC
jgi:hypothetical protein